MSVPAAALVVVVVIELVEAGVVLVLVVDEELGTLEDEAAFGSSMVNIDEDICSEVELGVSPLGTNRNTQVREAERSLVGIEAVHVTDSEVDTSKLARRAVSIKFSYELVTCLLSLRTHRQSYTLARHCCPSL